MRVVLCTAPVDRAEELARALVEERLAACVNIVPHVTSVYRWKGAVERDSEALLVIKSPAALFARLEARLRELHPYEVFELLALPVEEGHRPYLDWVRAETAKAGD
jgi:periplasmic divalent cation tolerance protein